jgi:protein-L-isoaspartate O-methyltransferase
MFQRREDGTYWKSKVVNGELTFEKVRGDEESCSVLFARLTLQHEAEHLEAERRRESARKAAAEANELEEEAVRYKAAAEAQAKAEADANKKEEEAKKQEKEEAAKRKAAADVELCSAYDLVRRHYTDSESAVQGWRNSKSNLSQGPLNKQMLQMLELQPGMTIADLGSGCGITAIAFSVFGCSSVLGFEIHEYSCEVAREMAETIRLAAAAEGRGQVTMPTFINAAVNERLRGGGEMMFDRLHGGYMMSQENASRYVREHLNPNGIAVMNVGSGNNGAVTIFRKDAAGIVSSQEPGIKVVFQEDLHPSFTPAALPAPDGQHTHTHTNTRTHTLTHTHTHTHTHARASTCICPGSALSV